MTTKVGTNDDIQTVWKKFKQNQTDQALRNRLIERFLPLVRYNAERVWAKLPEGVDLNDLISAGVFGLMDAIEAFDLERGVKFETYCVPRIRGAMLDENGWPAARFFQCALREDSSHTWPGFSRL